MTESEIRESISAYIRERFLGGDHKGELEETSPLLEWGVLNSLNTAQLIGHIRVAVGVKIPAMEVNPENFRDVRSITALVTRQRTAAA
ncbi:acyl carrier protein [Streptomyces coffeae]|uniref:Acyl carrier protein n=1 Tax=Streptomyces coffeae TaxID=621382 RepID=A0ABS1NQZ1_9ACTN|nr:phosphopantetheine-binding protein [Streptomyces coffeae]MBL1102483.1 acyl carrier protein [Streptomyces coffeae]